jgi:hypothetical protein
MAQQTSKFSPAERRNWGYWDGVATRKRGRLPEWSPRVGGTKHPHDKQYGEGFWLGWYDLTPPKGAVIK